MSLKRLEKKALEVPGAAERIARLEDEYRFAVALTALCENVLGLPPARGSGGSPTPIESDDVPD